MFRQEKHQVIPYFSWNFNMDMKLLCMAWQNTLENIIFDWSLSILYLVNTTDLKYLHQTLKMLLTFFRSSPFLQKLLNPCFGENFRSTEEGNPFLIENVTGAVKIFLGLDITDIISKQIKEHRGWCWGLVEPIMWCLRRRSRGRTQLQLWQKKLRFYHRK